MREVEGEEDAPQDAVHPQLRDAVAVEVAAEDRVEGAADEDGRPRVAPVVEQLPQRRARAGPPSLQRRVGHSHSLSLPLPHYTQYVFQGIGYNFIRDDIKILVLYVCTFIYYYLYGMS